MVVSNKVKFQARTGFSILSSAHPPSCFLRVSQKVMLNRKPGLCAYGRTPNDVCGENLHSDNKYDGKLSEIVSNF